MQSYEVVPEGSGGLLSELNIATFGVMVLRIDQIGTFAWARAIARQRQAFNRWHCYLTTEFPLNVKAPPLVAA